MKQPNYTAQVPKGIGGIWSHITGKHSKIRQENETQAWQSHLRDRSEKDMLIMDHLTERQKLQKTIARVRDQHLQDISEIRHEIAEYLSMQRSDLPKIEEFNNASGVVMSCPRRGCRNGVRTVGGGKQIRWAAGQTSRSSACRFPPVAADRSGGQQPQSDR